MRVLLAGASGMIGTALAEALRSRGDTVITLVRGTPRSADQIGWDPARGDLDPSALAAVDAVVGLNGAPVGALPWTRSRRAEILTSRVNATRTLATAIRAARSAGHGPSVFVSASGVNAYGNARPGQTLTEASPGPDGAGGFLHDVVLAWESAARDAEPSGVRVAMIRTGIVTGRGGAFDKLELLARVGMAGPIGDGRGVWPWISLRDEVGAILHILDGDLAGPVNLVGPTPATSSEVIRAVAAGLGRPYWLPAPRWALKATLGSAAEDLLLIDLPAVPKALLDSGYVFRDRTIEEALSAPSA